MRRTWMIALILYSVFLLTGCPLESTVPIGNPRPGSLDSRLQGLWSSTDPNDGAVTQIQFLPFNNAEYYVELREKDKEPERYRVYTVTLGGQQFLNINELKGGTKSDSFSFARYSVSEGGVLSLRFVGDKAIPKTLGADQKALVDFLTKHLNGTVLDDPDKPTLLQRPKADKM